MSEQNKKIRIGVFGVGRGTSMINYCERAQNAEVVAICDKWEKGIEDAKAVYGTEHITYYHDFDSFIRHDMDAVVLANYAHEHAPFAVRAMKAGKHVLSEVLPVNTLAQAVELVEAVEETGKTYAYGENYCYMPGPWEMRRLYREGKIGELEYAEGEYVHNCESIWPSITYGEEGHWRNNKPATFYCTHSFGPIVHATGLRPVSVTGTEGTMTERNLRMGSKSGQYGIEMVKMSNGAVVKSIHGGLYRNSIWYSLYGAKGEMETAREATGEGINRLYVNADPYSGYYQPVDIENYEPKRELDRAAAGFGHGNSDFYLMWNFVEKLRGNPEADTIDVYEALDMGFVGLFAYRSVLAGGVPMAIPDFRDRAVREQYRNDVACTDPAVAGDQLLPTFSLGTPKIPGEVYDRMKDLWIAGGQNCETRVGLPKEQK